MKSKELYFPLTIQDKVFHCVTICLMLIGLSLSVYLIICQADQSSQLYPKFYINTQSLVLKNIPSYLSPFITQIVPQDLPDRLYIFEPNLCSNIAHAYYKNPWIHKVKKVQKIYPNFVQVQVELRQPLCFIQYEDIFFLCDSNGIRLPGEFSDITSYSLPILKGYKGNLPEIGHSWHNISNILTILKRLQKENINISILEICPQEHYQVLIFSGVCNKIIWGVIDYPDFIDISSKIQLLKNIPYQFLQQELEEPIEIDLRFGKIIKRVIKVNRSRSKVRKKIG